MKRLWEVGRGMNDEEGREVTETGEEAEEVGMDLEVEGEQEMEEQGVRPSIQQLDEQQQQHHDDDDDELEPAVEQDFGVPSLGKGIRKLFHILPAPNNPDRKLTADQPKSDHSPLLFFDRIARFKVRFSSLYREIRPPAFNQFYQIHLLRALFFLPPQTARTTTDAGDVHLRCRLLLLNGIGTPEDGI